MVMQSRYEWTQTCMVGQRELPFQLVLMIGVGKRELFITNLTIESTRNIGKYV